MYRHFEYFLGTVLVEFIRRGDVKWNNTIRPHWSFQFFLPSQHSSGSTYWALPLPVQNAIWRIHDSAWDREISFEFMSYSSKKWTALSQQKELVRKRAQVNDWQCCEVTYISVIPRVVYALILEARLSAHAIVSRASYPQLVIDLPRTSIQ